MKEDSRDGQDSDENFVKPSDDFTFYLQAFKSEEKKIIQNLKFEDVVSLYWQLLRDDSNSTKLPYISQEKYTDLMKRVYKVLLPLYREQEMASEINQEWLMDSKGQSGLSFNLLAKLLYRIANQWAVHIDLDEYCDLLHTIFQRITCVKMISTGEKDLDIYESVIYPEIHVSFPFDEKKIEDLGGQMNKEGSFDEWIECRSDESNKSDFEYKYEEGDADKMVVKKFKKSKLAGQEGDPSIHSVLKEPIYFKETVKYNEVVQVSQVYQLSPFENILPLGFATEQFFSTIKNQIHDIFREQIDAKRKQGKKDLQDISPNVDTGLVKDISKEISTDIQLSSQIVARIVLRGGHFNYYRELMRNAVAFPIRQQNLYPKPGYRVKSRAGLNSVEPVTEINKFEYNPALERRLLYKLIPSTKNPKITQWLNIQYMIDNKEFEAAYRADVQRIETKGKLSIKEEVDSKKEEEFNHVETSYKKLRQIMLFKKFDAIYSDRAGCDSKEHKRLKKLIERDDKRRAEVRRNLPLVQKSLAETYEEKTFLKMMKGPYYQLQSKEGPLKNNFEEEYFEEVIKDAQKSALRILVVGKPRSGKSALASNLCAKLDLVHINIDNWVNALLAKIKAYEPPEDLEEGQEPPKWLSDLEEEVQRLLLAGGEICEDHQNEIIKLQMRSPLAQLKGFVLDLSYGGQRQFTWATMIRQSALEQAGSDSSIKEFSHIIEILLDDEEIYHRASTMRLDPSTGLVYSKWDREERKKPRVIPEGEEEAEEEDENAIKPLDEEKLIQRPNDTEEALKKELYVYNTSERSAIEELLINLYDSQYIKIEAAGLTPIQITDSASVRIKPDDDTPLRPLAIVIENGSDFKSLLTEGLEENEIPRNWSLWKQTDPVALEAGKLVQGLPEYAAHYSGHVFVFSTEENLKAFIIEPKKYIDSTSKSKMASQYRVLMLGPKGVGKHTLSDFLNSYYGWRVVDFKSMVKARLERILQRETHTPNNPEGGEIGLSEQEKNEILEGKPFAAHRFIPWIIDELGYKLEKRKPPPPPPKDENEEPVEEEEVIEDEPTRKKKEIEARKKREEEEKKRKEEEEKERVKEERRKKRQDAKDQGLDLVELGLEESEEEPIIIDDLSIDDLVLGANEDGVYPFIGKFILLEFPETEEHMTKLKEHGIEFDRILFLNDQSEEDPGAEIKKRMAAVDGYDWDFENENAQRILGLAKEHLGGEDIVKEINCIGTVDDVLIRIRKEIDPFYPKVDNAEDVRVSADLGEEDKPLPKSDYGDYCPVTYFKDNWIVRGNVEQEVTILGKSYWPAGEREAEEFKFDTMKFIPFYRSYGLPLPTPPPRIMIVGNKGAGVSTQIRMLAEKYKLNELNLKEEYLKKLKEEKEIRKRRRLLDRGFRPPAPADEETGEVPPDPEIEEDPEDFEKEVHERLAMQMIYDNQKGYVIDGTWRDIPEGTITQSLQDLLFESRRVPEIVIILKCKEQNTFKRMIDVDSIKAEYDRLMEARAVERQKLRQEDREKQLETLRADEEKTPDDIANEMATWEENRDQEEEAAEENDPEKPVLDDMIEKFREVLRETRSSEDAMFEEFGPYLKDKKVFVIDDIKADTSIEYIHIKIIDRIKDNFGARKDLIEKQQAQALKPTEVPFYEKSYLYRQSKFGLNSPISESNPSKTKKFAVLYRDRIYFLANAEEQEQFLKEPSRYTKDVKPTPLDVNIKPKVFVLGLPKTGKSTLCKQLAERIGCVHLQMTKVVQGFMEGDSIESNLLRRTMLEDGRQLSDDLLVSLLQKRISMKDCYQKGWVLEDFPKTRNQAIALAKRSILPTNVFYLKSDLKTVYEKTLESQNAKFGSNRNVLRSRIQNFMFHIPYLIAFYSKYYNSVTEVDSSSSKWFVSDKCISEIQANLKARQQFTRDYYLMQYYDNVCKIKNLNMDRCLVRQSLSPFGYYCPVTWRNEKQIVKCSQNPEDAVLYQNFYYFFRSERERDIFALSPNRFIMQSSFPKPGDLPIRVQPHKAAEVIPHDKFLQSHCSVTLMDEERVEKGDPILVVVFKDQKFVFHTEFKLQRFLSNPFKYFKAVLPNKMPPPQDKVSLFNLQKLDDSISFMEQSMGQIVTRALREIGENRLKYPTISLKETMLKMFALFLKTENPAKH